MPDCNDKRDLIEEEKAALDTPLDAAIHTARLHPDTQEAFETEAKAFYAAHSDVFASYEEAEYFSMLPLNKSGRRQVMDRALQLVKEEQAAKQAWPAAPVSER